MTVSESPSVQSAGLDEQNPWPGLEFFREKDSFFFHGREQETEELLRLVKRETLTILFSRSGLGKTSLLRAGLFPKLRDNDYLPLYIRLDFSATAERPEAQVKASIIRAIEADECEAPRPTAEQSLWEYFHARDANFWSENSPVMPVVVFDQFEEIFTLGKATEALRATSESFLTQLADLAENRPPAELRQRLDNSDSELTNFSFGEEVCKVVLSLREDYLPELEGLRPLIPSVMNNRFRIQPMGGEQAFAVVSKPAPKLVDRQVATQIVRFVAAAAAPANTKDEAAALKDLEIDPALLSLFCRELNNHRIANKQSVITADLAGVSSQEILTNFYEDCIAKLPAESRLPARIFVEQFLLTDSGHRDNVALEKALRQPGIDRDVIKRLVDLRLLRREERYGGQPRVELTHDVLTGVVRASRDARLLQEDEARKREFAEQERQKAEAKAKEEHDRAEREKEEKERAEALVQQAKEAREQADEIITFLIYQLRDQLSTIGQVQLLADVNDKAIGYFEKLGSDEQTPDVEWNKAVALQSRGHIRADAGLMSQAVAAHEQSLAIFRKLAESPDANERHFYGLATECSSLAWSLLTQGRTAEARKLAEEAFSITKTWAEKENTEFVWASFVPFYREGYANILRSEGKLDEAIKYFEQNLEIHQTALAANPNDEMTQIALSTTHIGLGDSLRARGELGHALKCFEKSLEVRKALAESKPSDVSRQHNLSQSYDRVGEALQASGKINDSLEAFKASDEIFQRLARYDQNNANWKRNYSVTRFRLAEIESLMGVSPFAADIFFKVMNFRAELAAVDESNAEARDDLAEAHLRYGDSEVLYGQLTNAAKNYDEAVALRTKLAESDSTNTDRVARLADAIERVGDLQLLKRNTTEALANYTRASETRQRLAENDKSNRLRLSDLADTQIRIGDAHKLQGDHERALQIYSEAFAVREQLADADPDNAQWQGRLAAAQGKLGEIYVMTKDLQAAEEHLFPALQLLTRLAGLGPENGEWRIEAADLNDSRSQVYSSAGQTKFALDILRSYIPTRESFANVDEKNFKRHAELARTLYLTSQAWLASEEDGKVEAAGLLIRARDIMQKFRDRVELTYEQQEWLAEIEAATNDEKWRGLIAEATTANSPSSTADNAPEEAAEPPESPHIM
jgi:tetratricopeptide (TPR) repeat protein